MIFNTTDFFKESSDEEKELEEYYAIMDCVFRELMDKVANTHTLQGLQESEVKKILEMQSMHNPEMDNEESQGENVEDWQKTTALAIVKLSEEMLNSLLCMQHGIKKAELEKTFYTFLDEYIKVCEDASGHEEKEKLLFQLGKSLEDIIVMPKKTNSYQ